MLAQLAFGGQKVVDPERVFRLLTFLHAVETVDRPVDTRQVIEPIEVSALIREWHPDIQSYLDEQRQTAAGSPTGLAIDQLWMVLLEVLAPPTPPADPDHSYLRDLVSAMRGQTIVTLNYDNLLQHVRSFALTVSLDDGPEPPDWSIPLSGRNQNQTVRVIPLHGSLAWRRNAGTGDVRVAQPDELDAFRCQGAAAWGRDTPAVIFGAGNKLRPDGPYLQLYSEFQAVLGKARQLVIIGYSFRDEHVNEALRRWYLSAAAGTRLRIGRREDAVPDVVGNWGQRDEVNLQVIPGRARDSMRQLLAPIPWLDGGS